MRIFNWDEQQAFAAMSGDSNPIHMDPAAARRTSAGACVVHGMQSLLWMLEQASVDVPLADMSRLEANFMQFLYVGEAASLTIGRATADQAKLELRTADRLISRAILRFGARPSQISPLDDIATPGALYRMENTLPEDRSWDDVASAEGGLVFDTTQTAARDAYPRLTDALGLPRVTALLALTRLVGMVSPGLHSTFHTIAVDSLAAIEGPTILRYATVKADARFQLVTIRVEAPGIAGSVSASRRNPPTRQPSSASLQATGMGRFKGHYPLVIGGSRGLGELTAKLLAMGGAETTITYATGQHDAEDVVRDIQAAGGTARAIHVDVLDDLDDLRSRLGGPVTSVYFFATCRIASRPSSGYSAERFAQFNRFYVDAFYRLCLSLIRPDVPLAVFYPSSVFVTEPRKGMLEYAMAKAAGEVLAADLTRFYPMINVETVRLPRLPTDQTAGLIEKDLGSAVDWSNAIVKRVEERSDE